MILTGLLSLTLWSAADSIPESVVITGPDTAIGSSWPAVNLYYCATGLMPNSVSQWDITNFSGFGPYPPYNNPGSCQYFNLMKDPSWIPSHHVVSCTNYGSIGYFNTYIIPKNSNQTFDTMVRIDDACATQRVTTSLHSNLYRAQPVLIFPHRWQYRHPGSGIWTDFLDQPGNLSGVDVNVFYANPTSERYLWTTDSLLGHPVYDTTFYEGGSVRLNLNNPPAALDGIWIRKVLDRYAGSSVVSDSVQIESVAQPVELSAPGADTVAAGYFALYFVSNPQLFSQFQWSVDGGHPIGSLHNDRIWVRWDSVGTGTVSVQAWSTSSCANEASTSTTVRGLSMREDRLATLRVHPHPNSGSFSVELPQGSPPLHFDLIDLTGRSVCSGKMVSEIISCPLSAGTYVLVVAGYAPFRLVVLP